MIFTEMILIGLVIIIMAAIALFGSFLMLILVVIMNFLQRIYEKIKDRKKK